MQNEQAPEQKLVAIFRDILALNDRQRDKWSDDHSLKDIVGIRPTIGEIRALVRQYDENTGYSAGA